ncbi:conserved hypothetical protein [Talaromyces marneffei ATCC 18224]|uniref:AB hydrolase-1 domain-containing protein n=1 Tax=Talaromyces marneffei (strain ATCC 18224 / CBS 334.59 / QM 7333) TaxID=441960 RepID=B6QI82_TALMQ|nr:conserved hypothetical protein [Talaromyces marneffei ATCC 18224]
MVAGVGLFASGGPWEAGTHHMSRIRRLTRTLAVYWPSGLGVLLGLIVRGLRAIATSGTIVRRVDAWLEAQYAGKERKETEETEWMRHLYKVLVQLSLKPIYYNPRTGGFKFKDVDFNPVRIWHGGKDRNSPVAVMRYLTQRLPHSVLIQYENDTHYTMFPHLEGGVDRACKRL